MSIPERARSSSINSSLRRGLPPLLLPCRAEYRSFIPISLDRKGRPGDRPPHHGDRRAPPRPGRRYSHPDAAVPCLSRPDHCRIPCHVRPDRRGPGAPLRRRLQLSSGKGTRAARQRRHDVRSRRVCAENVLRNDLFCVHSRVDVETLAAARNGGSGVSPGSRPARIARWRY